jgi:FKBP-type peptidyl-prolyl cis-trans isomerase
MLKRHFLTTFALAALVLSAGSAWSEDAAPLKTDKERLSYSIGASIGRNLSKDATDVDLNVLIEGLKASLAGQKLKMTEKEIRLLMSDYEKQLRKQTNEKRQKAQIENREKGETFLTEFKKKPGVQETPGGVLYQVVKAGDGRKPIETDTVQVNYRGSLINGTEFDATEPGHPAELKVMALISGWKQALTMMNAGAKWHIVIPSHLAYGERGAGSDIGPNEALVFDVELVGIK